MNFKTTLVLTLLATVVVAYFVFIERGTPSPRNLAREAAIGSEEQGTVLFESGTIDPDAVTRVRIKRSDQNAVLEYADERWWQVEPVRFPLSAGPVRSLASTVAELRYLDRFEPGTADTPTRAAAGLTTPRATLTLEHGGTTTTLHLGDRSLGSGGYLMRDGDEHIYVVPATLHDRLLDSTVSDWRQRTFDSPNATATDRVVLDRRDERIELNRQDGQWFLGTDQTQRASADAINRVAEAVKRARIEVFVADQPETLSRYGLADPRLTCILHTPVTNSTASGNATKVASASDRGEGEPGSSGDGTTYTLRIGSATDLTGEQFFATWSVGGEPSSVVFTLTRSAIEPLEANVDDLRDPRLITSDAREIKALKVTRPNQPALHLVRDVNEGFVFGESSPAAGTDYSVDYDAATSLLANLAAAKASSYYSGSAPASQPLATVTLMQRGSGTTETLRLYEDPANEAGQDKQETYLSVRNNEPVGYRVPKDTLAGLFKPRLAFRNRDVLTLQAADIAQVTLQRDDGVTFTFHPPAASDAQVADGSAWTLEGEKAFESGALAALLDALSPLRAERWVTNGTVTPGDGWCTLTVQMQDGSQHVLRVDPQTRRAVMDGIEPGFVLPQSVVDRLAGEYRERTALDLSRAQIASVTVHDGEQTLTIYRGADNRYATETGQDIDQSKAGQLFDTLVGLEVERYVSTEPDALPESARRIHIKTQEGQVHELALRPSSDRRQPRLATLNGQPIRLKPNDYDKFTATLLRGQDQPDQPSDNATTPNLSDAHQ